MTLRRYRSIPCTMSAAGRRRESLVSDLGPCSSIRRASMTAGAITILTGGQTGVDRGALDAALDGGAPCGGWCPARRRAEDGYIPARYPVQALCRGGYLARTRKNVEDSDATLVITFGTPTGGTARTIEFCRELRKPHLIVDAGEHSVDAAIRETLAFVGRWRLARLNVAGPRRSREPAGHEYAYAVVRGVLAGTAQLASVGMDGGGSKAQARSARQAGDGTSGRTEHPGGKRGKA